MAHSPNKRTRRKSGLVRKPPSNAGAFILIADDDDSVRFALRTVFVEDGFEVRECVNGSEALELLGDAADGHAPVPDAMVLDVCMPGFSGLGILGAMRRMGLVVPTVVVTGFVDKSVDAIAQLFGASVFHKPFDLEEVRRAVLDAVLARGNLRAK